MSYEINVSQNGKHVFATAERSITTEPECKNVVKLFLKAFPKEEGYEINVTCWRRTGECINLKKLLES